MKLNQSQLTAAGINPAEENDTCMVCDEQYDLEQNGDPVIYLTDNKYHVHCSNCNFNYTLKEVE